MAADDFSVRGDGLGGAVGVHDDFPAATVNHHQMMEFAIHFQVIEAGFAALRPLLEVVDVAPGGAHIAAAGPAAVLDRAG